MLTFREMIEKFGEPAAYHWLLEIERAARLSRADVVAFDPQVRLDYACQVQDYAQMAVAA